LDGSSKLHGAICVFAGDGGPFVPNENRLLAGYPNPFNPDVTLQLELARPAVVEAEVLDLLGRRLRKLVPPTSLRAGTHRFLWNGCDENGRPVSAGVYFVRFLTDRNESLIDKLVKCN
ncbi:MAG TPA: T9SS type A sorting domain-containing protein, partial [bacterium]|nr:T9SS type A sorting domain-containing protein [bacterium]